MTYTSNFGAMNTTPFEINENGANRFWGLNNAGVAAEDWVRAEQSADNALVRDLHFLEQQNKFNADEAQKTRDFTDYQRQTAYQTAVEDMKKAGLNPILAYQNGGANAVATSSAQSGGTRSSGSSHYNGTSGGQGFANLMSGLFTITGKLIEVGGQLAGGKKVGKIGF